MITGNDIIKALEHHTDGSPVCKGCPLEFSDYNICDYELVRKALALIKSQKAEIDYWKSNTFDGCMERGRIDKEARAEAIKEFAEMLDDKSESLWWLDDGEPSKSHVERFVLMSDVYNLVKEMVGET